MAKQRRSNSHRAPSHGRKSSRTRTPSSSSSRPASAVRTGAVSVEKPRREAPPPPPVPKRTSYVEALATYERGIEALQRRDFTGAAELLRVVLDRYPDERELHERARLYLKVCERQTGPAPAPPRTVADRIYAATVALNAGKPEEAFNLLQGVLREEPDHDHAEYMMAVTQSARGDTDEALKHLRRAIELNAENRSLAAQEPEFDGLRDNEQFRQVLESGAAASHPRRRSRGRSR
jgi:tetratricopeptide (TPR) repeat protein